jgi:histidinol-phosphate/aromatic aminotransferase/cobyric acid decarboxylase-like protein
VRRFAAPKMENHLRLTVPKLEQTHHLLDIIRGLYV